MYLYEETLVGGKRQIPAGVEGVMRSCCEKTMGVLRQNKESLLTIIEVSL